MLVIVLLLIIAVFIGIILTFYFMYRKYTKRHPKPEYRHFEHKPNVLDWSHEEVSFTWIGHSTVLIGWHGYHILTDPVFADRVGVNLGITKIGPKRYTPPAMAPEDLPHIDLVLLSHAHLDHVDLESLKRVVTKDTEVITARGTQSVLRRVLAKSVYELGGTDELILPSGPLVRAVPVRHWGARFPWNKSHTYTGYVVSYRGTHVFFAGDTAYVDTFSRLKQEVPPIDVAILPIGAYAPDIYQGSHCTPEQAWKMFLDTGARYLVPVHWNTFVLSEEPVDEPIMRLKTAAGDEASRIVIELQGQEFILPKP